MIVDILLIYICSNFHLSYFKSIYLISICGNDICFLRGKLNLVADVDKLLGKHISVLFHLNTEGVIFLELKWETKGKVCIIVTFDMPCIIDFSNIIVELMLQRLSSIQ